MEFQLLLEHRVGWSWIAPSYPPTACCRLRGRSTERPLPFPGVVVRTRVYVDGFNLYYGALKGTRFKWLDPIRLVALLLLRGYRIDRLRYFTARVSEPDHSLPIGFMSLSHPNARILDDPKLASERFIGQHVEQPGSDPQKMFAGLGARA